MATSMIKSAYSSTPETPQAVPACFSFESECTVAYEAWRESIVWETDR